MTAERQNAAAAGLHRARTPEEVLSPLRAKLRFERLPATYCHPGRIGALMPEGLPVIFRDRLKASARLRLRLSDLITERFQLQACTIDDLATPEGRFAQLEGDDLEDALRRIGAIWHARKIRKIILKDTLRDLIQRLGRDTHRAALRFIDLAPEEEEEENTPDVDTLLGWIERDGRIAVNAWCRHQPACLGERLRLKLPPGPDVDDEPQAGHRDRGLLIVDRVVTTLMAVPEMADHHD